MNSRLWILLLLCLLVGNTRQAFDIRYNLASDTIYYPQGPPNGKGYTLPPDTCSLRKIQLVSRHGARYPTSGVIQDLENLQTVLNDHHGTYNQKYGWMGNWTCSFCNDLLEGELLPVGMKSAYQLAKRLRRNFGGIMNQTYYPYRFKTLSSVVSRTGRTGNSFLYSMTEGEMQKEGNPLPYVPFFLPCNTENEDYLMRFFKNCPNYEALKSSPRVLEQRDIWDAEQFPGVRRTIQRTIGIQGKWNMSLQDVNTMFDACAFEMAVNMSDTYHFCSLFDEHDAEIIQYSRDLKQWWSKSYGYTINYQIACYLFSTLINDIETMINGSNSDEVASLSWGHFETVIPFMSLLGLFHDSEPLMANSSMEFIENRKFQTRKMGTFMTNVVWTVYNCSNTFKIRMLVNEEETKFPGCDDLFCDLDTVKRLYAKYLGDECGWCDVCFNSTTEWPPYTAEIGVCPVSPSPQCPAPPTPVCSDCPVCQQCPTPPNNGAAPLSPLAGMYFVLVGFYCALVVFMMWL